MTPPPVGLILDIQHTGRKSKPGDLGAAYDLDSDGHPGEPGEREVDLVRGYVQAAYAYGDEVLVPVHVLDSGEYGARHERAIQIARMNPGFRWAYLACHTNAGGGRYAFARPDYRSKGGEHLAVAVVNALKKLPEIDLRRVEPLYPNGAVANKERYGAVDTTTATGIAWWTRGWSCIDGIYAGPSNLCGVLIEPFFGDSPAHKPLTTPEGLARVGRALVDGVIAWGA